MEKAVWVLVALVMVGCAHTNILPYANGDFLMVATSANESVAYDEAIKQSQEYCSSQNRRFALVQHQTQYQGMDKTARGVIGALAQVLGLGHSGVKLLLQVGHDGSFGVGVCAHYLKPPLRATMERFP